MVLAVTGWTTNQRLIDSQRYITGEVLPLQDASRGMVLTMGAFGQRHADLLAAENATGLDAVTTAALDERFQTARQGLSGLITQKASVSWIAITRRCLRAIRRLRRYAVKS